jgi:UDPglucose 6-dehydrogenase
VLQNVDYRDGPYEVIKGADAVVILTEWNAYRALDLARVKSLLSSPIMVDLRNVYNPAEIKAAGFSYTGIGR